MGKSKLLDDVRNLIRVKHLSYRTEKIYVNWIKRYIYYHNIQHPKDLRESDINNFLTHLATERKVAASTQSQALNAILFLYREVLGVEFGLLDKEKNTENRTNDSNLSLSLSLILFLFF